MLNVGPQELLLILIVALVVVGPQRLPEIARSIGKGLRSLRSAQDEMRRTVQEVLEPEAASEVGRELRRTREELRGAFRADPSSSPASGPSLPAPTSAEGEPEPERPGDRTTERPTGISGPAEP